MDQTWQRLIEKQNRKLDLIASLLQEIALGPATLIPKEVTPQVPTTPSGSVESSKTQAVPCKDHPKYGGLRKPRTNCPHCWELYEGGKTDEN